MSQEIVYQSSSWGSWMFLVVAIVILYFFLERYRNKKRESFGEGESCGIERNILLYWMRIALISMSFIMLIVSLMQPSLKSQQEEVNWKDEDMMKKSLSSLPFQEIVFLVDVSNSMGVKDAQDEASRIDRMKEILDELIDQMGGVSISLYAFSGDTINLIPQTFDLLSVSLSVKELFLSMTKKSGTSFSQLIDAMTKKYLNKNLNEKICIILFSDGEDTDLVDLPKDVRKQAEDVIANQVQAFPKDEIYWYTIGIGSEKGGVIPGLLYDNKNVISEMDPYFLQKIAEEGKGRFFKDEDFSLSDLNKELLSIIFKDSIDKNSKSIDQKQEPHSLFYYPAGLSFILLALSLSLKERRD